MQNHKHMHYGWGTIISVSFPSSCVFMRWDCRQHCITFICTGTEVIRSLWMLEMTPGALDSFHVAGAVLESVHKSDQINSRQGLPEVSVTNRFLIWFEWEKNSWIKSVWRKKKEKASLFVVCVCVLSIWENMVNGLFSFYYGQFHHWPKLNRHFYPKLIWPCG